VPQARNTELCITKLTATDDASLWLAAISGTATAFATLFQRHRSAVFRKAYGKTHSIQDAEDVVATVFLEAWRNKSKVRVVQGSILPWLLATTTFVTLNQQRSMRRYRNMLAALPAPTAQPDHAEEVLDRIEMAERNRELDRILVRLNTKDQVIVDLCLVEQMTMVDVALVLDIPTGTVKSRLNRIRQRLQGDLRLAFEHPVPIASVDEELRA
jgi:RNA polymerase sigma factor (sigma-70 family)